ncbi:hypothetical protein KAU33_07415 [Candidatus Dependentiae bacterium]|nr:hypothetical protein [Candidatus Dependentiae bacterium]
MRFLPRPDHMNLILPNERIMKIIKKASGKSEIVKFYFIGANIKTLDCRGQAL